MRPLGELSPNGRFLFIMAFTSTDLDTVKDAIMALAAGARTVQIGGRMYRKSGLDALWELYENIKAELSISDESGLKRGTFPGTTNQDDNE